MEDNAEKKIDLKELEKEIYNKLKAPFPIEAYSIDTSRGFPLTSLKAQYIKERLNDVFGITGWQFEERFEEKEKGVICHGILTILFGEDRNARRRQVQATGGCAYKDKAQTISDVFKSAATESLSKATSYVGVGNEMYKGNIATATLGKPRGKFDTALKAIQSAKTKEEIDGLSKQIESRKWDEEEVVKLQQEIEKVQAETEKELKAINK